MARAYDEAARLMCGSWRLKPTSLTIQLHFNRQGTQNKAPTPHVDSNNGIAAGTDNGKGVVSVVEKRPLLSVQETEANWVVKKAKVETTQQFKPLEEDHIEQMIEELLHYSSIELFNFNV
ncbi:hypothetical protein Goshw_010495 [Gossypium schwendimanii]|uniref:AP2/ERF domain-containing protein n=1 Tax=Gossypium schwendimanii TaxID=34291 RepID=A0A7J9MT33_GOSSC|nr:hypothetical protein [Gossypium schwendimanii]